MSITAIADFLTGAASFGDIGKERKLQNVFGSLARNLHQHQPDVRLEQGAAFQIGPYVALIQDDIHGYEIGYRMRDLKFIIAQDGEKKIDFWRDGMEFELAGAKRCEIAPGPWHRDFRKACKTYPATFLDLPFDEKPDPLPAIPFAVLASLSADLTGLSPNRPEMMWKAMQATAQAMPQILQRARKGGLAL